MDFSTKFAPGDTAWRMERNKTQRVVITGITIKKSTDSGTHIVYDAKSHAYPADSDSYCTVVETYLFPSKDELLNSL